MPPGLSKEKVCTILVVGKTGVGKSSTLNTILGENVFKTGRGDSVTKFCSYKDITIREMTVRLIDAPGSMDVDKLDVTKIIDKYILEHTKGIDAFMLVLSAANRPTEEEVQVIELLKDQLGDGLTKHMMIAVTRADDLENDNETAEEFLQSYSKKHAVVAECLAKKRVLGINNRAKGEKREKQLEKLFDIVQRVIRENDGQFYSHATLKKQQQEAEERRKQKEAEEQKERERQEQLVREYEEKQRENERLKQQAEKEKKEREEEKKKNEERQKKQEKEQEEARQAMEKIKQNAEREKKEREEEKKKEQERQKKQEKEQEEARQAMEKMKQQAEREKKEREEEKKKREKEQEEVRKTLEKIKQEAEREKNEREEEKKKLEKEKEEAKKALEKLKQEVEDAKKENNVSSAVVSLGTDIAVSALTSGAAGLLTRGAKGLLAVGAKALVQTPTQSLATAIPPLTSFLNAPIPPPDLFDSLSPMVRSHMDILTNVLKQG